MIGTHRRRRAAVRDSSEDDSSQSRDQYGSNISHSRNTFDDITRQPQECNNAANNVKSSVTSRKQPKNLKSKTLLEDTSSSESDQSGKLFYSTRHGILSHLSDYGTGESSDRSSRSRRPVRTKMNQQDCDPNFSSAVFSQQDFLHSDSSSDDSEVKPRTVKNLKRPIRRISSSDSSDSGVPIGCRRSVKRMKLFSSSESSSESSSDVSGGSQRKVVGELIYKNTNSIERVNTNGLNDTISPRNDKEILGNGSGIVQDTTVQSFSGRIMPEVESDSESDLISTSHIVRGRRIPVIESDEDSGSIVEYSSTRVSSVQGTGQRVSLVLYANGIRRRRERRRRITLPSQENVRDPTQNVSDSGPVNHNVRRRRLVVESGSPEPYSAWEMSSLQLDETDDEIISVSNSHRVRGRRIPVVESEDDSDSVSNGVINETAHFNNEIISNRGNEASNNHEPNFINLRRRRISIDPNVHNGRGIHNNPLVQAEDESSNSEAEIRPRALSNRMVRIIPSDDSSSTSLSSSSDSDDSIPIRSYRRRINLAVPTLVDNDYEDIANDLEGFDVNIKASTVVKAFTDYKDGLHNENSSDSDGELEKCSICLTGFKTQEIGKPSSCDHKFCSLCIKEWASKNNTCPVDRKVFNGIHIYDNICGKVICEIPVQKATPPETFDAIDFFERLYSTSSDDSLDYDSSILEFDSDGDGPEEICSVCGGSHRPHRMITCDSCMCVFHLECLDPPLRDFPTINWYCYSCNFSMYSD